jgi:hypothetical protein
LKRVYKYKIFWIPRYSGSNEMTSGGNGRYRCPALVGALTMRFCLWNAGKASGTAASVTGICGSRAQEAAINDGLRYGVTRRMWWGRVRMWYAI